MQHGVFDPSAFDLDRLRLSKFLDVVHPSEAMAGDVLVQLAVSHGPEVILVEVFEVRIEE